MTVPYLVVDLEATCDDRGSIPRDETEIIEIGAVLVDGATFAPIAEFQTFVRPTVHPVLTPFCTELTTIAQADVATAPLFPAAAERLAAFGAHARFCSWGAYDKNQLERDARRHGIAMPLPGPHTNLKRVHGPRARRRGLGSALRQLGVAFAGTPHRGIDDARNIARILPLLLKEAA